MPPKRKESAATPVASGPKQKRSKTSFRTPTNAALEGTTSAASDVGSTSKNRVVTLRASASGRRGYRSQDLSTTTQSSSTASDSLAAENSALPSNAMGDQADILCEPIPPSNVESDTQPSPVAKSRAKQKNTTTVGCIG